MSRVMISLLGPPRLEREGVLVSTNTRKAIALLAFLALGKHSYSRDSLAALLWPDYDQSHARGALRNTLYELNKALGGNGLEILRESVAFTGGAGITLDVTEFRHRLDDCKAHGHGVEAVCSACLEPLAQAAALYRDDLLAGFNPGASPEFDEWQSFQTESWRRDLANVLERLSRGYRERGNFEAAIRYARRWQSLDPLDEVSQRRVMQLLALAGQRAAALQAYQGLVERLRDGLGAAPQAETTELYQAIRTNQLLSAPLHPTHGNLAAHLASTPFVGRETESSQLAHWFEDAAGRILIIVGPGGMGKTRLALQVALEHSGRFAEGAYFVPLAGVSAERGQGIISAIAEAIGFSFHGPNDPKMQLLNYLRPKQLLLVLDNFEHLRDHTALLEDIQTRAPRVKLLLTSRERLNLSLEYSYELQGLPFPGAERRDGTGLEDYGAVQLFVACARRVHWSFVLSASEARGVQRICQMVEGMPLGIELAAAWARVLSCEEIADELARDPGMLATTLGGVAERHRSLRFVLDYSWNQLDAETQRVFCRLTVSRGGFRRDAAVRVAGASLTSLTTLVDHSLLHRTATGRYEIHELLRQYGEEKLRAEAEQARGAHEAHCAFYAEFLHARRSRLEGKGQREVLEEIAAEIDNVRAAWDWAVEQRDLAAIRQSLQALSSFYWLRNRFREAHETFAFAAEALRSKADEILLGTVLAHQGKFAELLGDFDRAIVLHERSLTLLRPYGQQTAKETAFTLNQLGMVLHRRGDAEATLRVVYESLSLYQRLEEPSGIAQALNTLGNVNNDLVANFAEARRCFAESLALRQEIGDQRGVAASYNNLGAVLNNSGDYSEARRFLELSIKAHREISDQYGMALALNNLGYNSQLRQDYKEARQFYEASLAIRQQVGDRFAIALVLSNLGYVAMELGEYERAKRDLAESLALHREIGDGPGLSEVHTVLGKLALRTGQPLVARKYLADGLRIALDTGSALHLIENLVEVTALVDQVLAVEILAFLLDQPASDQITKERAVKQLAELGLQLSSEEVVNAQARTHGSKIDNLAKKVLERIE